MKPIRFVMIGGFLGAGKTTAIGRLARGYTEAGLRVGIVTNDQAYDLVDTQALRAQGFRVGEVPGACFCCKFDDLVETAAALSADERPDVIITEPVGSCTDLVATVIEPLRHLHGDLYEIAPLAVLLKPEHGRKILGGTAGAGFSPKAAYIFLKQVEEADVVVINKIDKLSPAELDELIALVGERFPDKEVLAISARDGTNFDALREAVGRTQAEHHKMMPVDYDIYAEGEAELGWLNCSVEYSQPEDRTAAGGEFSLDELLVDFVQRLGRTLADDGAEVAHLKIFGQAGSDPAIANLTSSDGPAELSLASEIHTDTAQLVVNARVAVDPEILAQVVEAEAARLAEDYGLVYKITGL
ncbi:MAG: cobalamin biosynthesis protein P47K, partial [Planctomycetes bacterium]|nr:cobalamin biosynthesis protein P47K [Planctomycetota bacterium]